MNNINLHYITIQISKEAGEVNLDYKKELENLKSNKKVMPSNVNYYSKTDNNYICIKQISSDSAKYKESLWGKIIKRMLDNLNGKIIFWKDSFNNNSLKSKITITQNDSDDCKLLIIRARFKKYLNEHKICSDLIITFSRDLSKMELSKSKILEYLKKIEEHIISNTPKHFYCSCCLPKHIKSAKLDLSFIKKDIENIKEIEVNVRGDTEALFTKTNNTLTEFLPPVTEKIGIGKILPGELP